MHKMLEGKKALLFDMDGTLVHSMGMWGQIDINFLARYGLTVPTDLKKSIQGLTFYDTAVYFKERFDLPESPEEIGDIWNEMAMDQYAHHIAFREGGREFLLEAKKRGYLLAICTINARPLAETFLESRGIRDCFSVVLTGDDMLRGKPAPDIYLTAAERLGVDPSDCLVFEDIVPGIQAGLAAGMEVCAVDDEHSAFQEEEKRELAQYYIEDYVGLFL